MPQLPNTIEERSYGAVVGMICGVCPVCRTVVLHSEPQKILSMDGFLRVQHENCYGN